MTNKRETIRKGARVRVANPEHEGPARWRNALRGRVLSVTSVGALVELDSGETVDRPWSWVDLETRPKPREMEILIGDVRPSRFQARTGFDSEGLFGLAKSIAEHGLINPILVFRLDDRSEAGFELIAGERRFRSSWALALAETEGANLSGAVELASAPDFWYSITEKGLGLEAAEQSIGAVVYEGDPEAYRPIAVIDNLQREDLSAVDEGAAFHELMIANEWTQTKLAGKLGKSKAYVSQRLSLLDLVPEARELARGAIPFDSARQVSTLPEALQAPIAKKIAANLAGDDPKTTRQVSAMIGRARRFFDPEHWIPDPEIPHSAIYRNVLRLIEYHIRYLMQSEPDRAPAILEALGDLCGKRPDTIASESFFAVRILGELSSAKGYSEIDHWWAPFAKLRGFGCETCQFVEVPGPWAKKQDRIGGRSRCDRWNDPENGASVATCKNWFSADGEPGVVIFLHWQPIKAIELGLEGDPRFEADAASVAAEWVEVNSLDIWAVTTVEAYRRALLMAEVLVAEQKTETERSARELAIEPIIEFWKAQELGAEGPFSLENGFAHRCRDCRRYAAELEAEFGAPCVFAEAPLEYTESWRAGRSFSPALSFLKGPDPGGLIPRCEGFQVRELDDLEPVDGLEANSSGYEVLLMALERICKGANMGNRNGAIPAPLAWVPYERVNRIGASTEALIAYLRRVDPGAGRLGRLLTVAIYEAKAIDHWYGPFTLVDPFSGELGHFSSSEVFNRLADAEGGDDDS